MVMTQKNDERILELKKQIADKKENLGKEKRFVPVTTCMLELFGREINLHTITSVKDINKVLIELNMYSMSGGDLGIDEDEIEISGFKLSEWIRDVDMKRDSLIYKSERAKLKKLNDQLYKLLSDDKKTELEIDSIEALLK